jgi:hypothetical protein
VAKAVWRLLLSVRRSEGVGEEDERGWRSMMGSEEKEVVMVGGVGMDERYLGTVLCLSVKTTVLSRAKGCFYTGAEVITTTGTDMS